MIGGRKMINFLKENIVSMIMIYIISLIIVLGIGLLFEVNLFSLFIVVSVTDIINFIKDYIKYKKKQ